MNKKLTLSVDDTVISRAKKYAEEHKESLSELVENYFRIITTEYKDEKKEIAPIVQELLGSLKVPEDFDYDNERIDYLEKKYLNG